MSVKRGTQQAEQMTEDEFRFWRSAFLKALPDCLSIERRPEFCAHIAAEVADSAVTELRRRK